MGLFSPDIFLQQLAASSAVYSYPDVGQTKVDTILVDEFARESLNPTGAYTVYTATSNDSNGSVTFTNNNRLRLTTDSSAIGDDENVRSSGLGFGRIATSTITDTRTQLLFRIVFNLVQTADTEMFLGIHDGASALAVLPTTARHMGVFADASAQANFILTSGNNSAQATADTGVALDTSTHRIDITHTGANAATIEFFDAVSGTTADATQTVTALGLAAPELQFFVQTEAAAAKSLEIREWRIEAS